MCAVQQCVDVECIFLVNFCQDPNLFLALQFQISNQYNGYVEESRVYEYIIIDMKNTYSVYQCDRVKYIYC